MHIALTWFAAALCGLGVVQDPPREEAKPVASVPERGGLNAQIVKTLRAYPTDGTHEYYWPKSGTWGGNTKDLHYKGELFAEGDPKQRCYCCGITFEVFLDAWRAWCEAEKREFEIPGIANAAALKKFRQLWFGSDGDKSTMQHALLEMKLGEKIAKLEDAEPGDFVQLWRHNGSGHAVIFVGWERDKKSKQITALRYWSTQGSTQGIGERTEQIGSGKKEIDREQLYIARVGIKPAKGSKRGEKKDS